MAARRKATSSTSASRRRIGVHTPVGRPLEIGMGFEVLLHDEMGLSSMRYIHNGSSVDSWRRCMSTYFESAAKVIRDTVVGEARHKSGLITECTRTAKRVRSAKSHAEVLTTSVEALGVLCFELLGRSAVQRGERQGARRNWSLARYRTLSYTRTSTQMVALILDCSRFWRDRLVEDVPEWSELVKTRMHACGGDDDRFVEWFRAQFPRSYASLF